MFAAVFWLVMGLVMFFNASMIEATWLVVADSALGVLFTLAGSYSGWVSARK